MSDDELKVLINNMIAKLSDAERKMIEATTEIRQTMEELEDALKSTQ